MNIFTKNSTYIGYCLLCIALLLVTEFFKISLHLDNLIYNSLAEKLTSQQIEDFLHLQKKWHWLGYLFMPILLLIKTSLITTVLYIGTFFLGNLSITLKQLWSLVLNVEFVFILVPLFKIIWFYFFQTNYTLEDIQYFYPLSAINITGYKGLEPWLIYPLQTLNLFELAYIIFLAYQIGAITKTNADTGLKIVAFSYVPALFLWVTVIMFFTLNYS